MISALEQELSHKPSDYAFSATELSMLDQLHTRGHASTVELAKLAEVREQMHVLDLGSGLGGPARYLAETFGCHVEGIDVSQNMIDVANYLSSRWAGPSDLVNFSVAGALSLPFPDESFDLVWIQHVVMNVANRDAMYREIRRVLKPGGRLATYDVITAEGDLLYPTPWASDASISTVLSAQETRDAMTRAGLRVLSFTLDTPAAREWAQKSAAAMQSGERPPGALMFRAALGENFRTIVGNLGRNYLEGRADVAAIIAER